MAGADDDNYADIQFCAAGDDKLSEGHADIRHHGERHPCARCKAVVIVMAILMVLMLMLMVRFVSCRYMESTKVAD